MAASFLTAQNLTERGFRHAFFTRSGGHSPPPVASLHFGAQGHSEHELAANVREAAFALGIAPAHLFTVTQVHGCEVREVNGTEGAAGFRELRADALRTAAVGVGCGVKVADCLSLLLADTTSGAVTAVHSGWQGTVGNIAGVAARAMQTATSGELIAAIGPHIRACCFEVGDDVAARLAHAAGTEDVVLRGRGRPHVDLAAVVVHQLRAAGVARGAIELVEGCSKCDPLRFFSYRRDGEKSGRNLAAIVARGARSAAQ